MRWIRSHAVRICAARICDSLVVVGAVSAALPSCAAEPSLKPILRGLSPSSLRIVGGIKAATSEWPWQLLLRIPRRGQGAVGYCGASLIAPRWVLTAAHCFHGGYDASRPVEIFEGLTYRDAHGEEAYEKVHRVGRPILNPGYDTKSQANDIALLHLTEDAVSQPVAPLAEVSSELEKPPIVAVATGWGTLTRLEQRRGGALVDYETKQPVAKRGLLMPHSLMKVELPLVDLARCRALNKDAGVVTDRNLCAGSPQGGKDTCKGDSGGPLVAKNASGRYVQIGVTSWGHGCGESNHPGVYTRVSAYADWIRTVTKTDQLVASNEPPKPAALPATPPTALPPQYDNTAGLSVKLVAIEQDKPAALDVGAVKPGQRVAVVVATKKPGYLIILDETPDGKLTQIFPNGFSSRALPNDRKQASLAPGREITVPDPQNPYAGFVYVVDKTVGDGMISVLESDTPLGSVDPGPNGCKTFASREEGRAYLANMSRELSRGFLPEGTGKGAEGETPKYSAVYLPYTVKQ